jgi:hypothetical protein
MTSADDGSNPAEILRATPAPDDAGAETADRYEWQAMMATADALSVYFRALDEHGNLVRGFDFTLICEHHEDWAILNGSTSEIVSAKHREASVGPFSTYSQVLDRGGVLHMFERWSALGETPLCRLVTTGGLANEAKKVADTCQRLRENPESQDEVTTEVVSNVAGVIGSLKAPKGCAPSPPPAASVRAFLASLRFHHGVPRRDHLPDMAAERYGRPVAERLGRPDAAGAIWQAVLALVRARMRAAGPARGGALPTVLARPHDDSLASRTLRVADVDTAVRFALTHAAEYAPLPRRILANLMAIKMARGGCSDNAIERADSLRLQYRQYWHVQRSTPTVASRRRQVDNMLSRVIDESTDVVRVLGTTWGAGLWRELGERLRVMEGQADAHGLGGDLLLGGASELANNCRAWYTDGFDARAELRQLVGEENAS